MSGSQSAGGTGAEADQAVGGFEREDVADEKGVETGAGVADGEVFAGCVSGADFAAGGARAEGAEEGGVGVVEARADAAGGVRVIDDDFAQGRGEGPVGDGVVRGCGADHAEDADGRFEGSASVVEADEPAGRVGVDPREWRGRFGEGAEGATGDGGD